MRISESGNHLQQAEGLQQDCSEVGRRKDFGKICKFLQSSFFLFHAAFQLGVSISMFTASHRLRRRLQHQPVPGAAQAEEGQAAEAVWRPQGRHQGQERGGIKAKSEGLALCCHSKRLTRSLCQPAVCKLDEFYKLSSPRNVLGEICLSPGMACNGTCALWATKDDTGRDLR